MARGTVLARVRGALVDALLADRAGVVGQAGALEDERIGGDRAETAVETGVGLAGVDGDLAFGAGVAGWAVAGEGVDVVDARA